MPNQEHFFNRIKEEREKQDKQWGTKGHSIRQWMIILMEEVGEVARAILESGEEDYSEVEKELTQVAAVACAIWEDWFGTTKTTTT